jgi:tetratricopeptide (TPR) repeat protein
VPVQAKNNYWGMNGAEPFERFCLPVDYIPFLTSPPVIPPYIQQPIFISNFHSEAVDTIYAVDDTTNILSPLENLIAMAEAYRLNNEYDEARAIYEEIVDLFGDDIHAYDAYARQYVLSRLEGFNSQEFLALQNYFTYEANLIEDDNLNMMIEHLISILYIDQNEYLEAIERFYNIILENPDTEEAVIAEMNIVLTEYIASLNNSGGFGKSSANLISNDIHGIIDHQMKIFGEKFGLQNEPNVIEIPKEYTLFQNYPNPFNPVTKIKYSTPFRSNVKVEIFNSLGQQVKEIVNGIQEAGYYEVQFDAAGYASGVYFYSIHAYSEDGKQNYMSTKKMILMK